MGLPTRHLNSEVKDLVFYHGPTSHPLCNLKQCFTRLQSSARFNLAGISSISDLWWKTQARVLRLMGLLAAWFVMGFCYNILIWWVALAPISRVKFYRKIALECKISPSNSNLGSSIKVASHSSHIKHHISSAWTMRKLGWGWGFSLIQPSSGKLKYNYLAKQRFWIFLNKHPLYYSSN